MLLFLLLESLITGTVGYMGTGDGNSPDFFPEHTGMEPKHLRRAQETQSCTKQLMQTVIKGCNDFKAERQ